MRSSIFRAVVLFVGLVSLASAANIFDLLSWDLEDAHEDKQRNDDAPRSCACEGPSCMCCVDFNLTFIDLGGPGCVSMKYLSQSEGLSVNVSYGESLLHSKQVKGPNPEPTCMPLLTNLAQICARFREFQPHNDGLRGCLLLEPKLLGDVTGHFDVGCFRMDPTGMTVEGNETSYTNLVETVHTYAGNSTEGESGEINEEEIIAAVNETAQKGLAFFGNLLGLAFGTNDDNKPTEPTSNSNTGNQPVT